MPRDTVALIDALVAEFGMTDQHFRQLHHMGNSITRHRDYCEPRTRFTAPSGNNATKDRLRAAKQELERQRDNGASVDWPAAIARALAAHPIHEESAPDQDAVHLGDTAMNELLTGADLDALTKAWAKFKASPVEMARVAVRRARAKQILEGFAAGAYRDVSVFETDVWQIESKTVVDGEDRTGTFYDDDTTPSAVLAALETGSAELHGNYIWRHATARFNPQRKAPEEKKQVLADIEALMNDDTLAADTLIERLQALTGIGPGVATALAMMKHPEGVALFNSIAPGLMANIGLEAPKRRDYQPIAEALRDELGAEDFIELDWFLFRHKYGNPPFGVPKGGTKPAATPSSDIYSAIANKGFAFPDEVVTTYLLSLKTKPFVILSGISGTGKTKLAQIVAEWAGTEEVRVDVSRPVSVPRGGWAQKVHKTMLEQNRLYVPASHVEQFALAEGEHTDVVLFIGEDEDKASMRAMHHSGGGIRYTLFYKQAITQKLNDYVALGQTVTISIDHVDDQFVVRIARADIKTETVKEIVRRHVFLSVRPDWMDGKSLLGFYNLLTERYALTRFLELLLQAHREPDKPYFVILDEMNLARVEHYFSDLLSVTESRTFCDDGSVTQEAIALHDQRRCLPIVDDVEAWEEPDACASCSCSSAEIGKCALFFDGVQLIPPELAVPLNVHITGTVNIDETTHMFSPKVLDRGSVIEFNQVNLDGSVIEEDVRYRVNDAFAFGRATPAQLDHFRTKAPPEVRSTLIALNQLLEPEHLHFGYRVANEIALYCLNVVEFVGAQALETALDLQILQKVLPKFHGTRQKLEAPLTSVFSFACFGASPPDLSADDLSNAVDAVLGDGLVTKPNSQDAVRAAFPRSAKKLATMMRTLREQGFVSFIE